MLTRSQLGTYAMEPLSEAQQQAVEDYLDRTSPTCPTCGPHKEWDGALPTGPIASMDFGQGVKPHPHSVNHRVVLICRKCHEFPFLPTTPVQVKFSEIGIKPKY